MRRKQNLTIASLLVFGFWAAPSSASELAEKGRDILNKNRHAVVTVQVVVKGSGPGGRSGESKQEITGTVVDPSGLTLLALSACDPAEMYRRVSSEYKVETEISDIKILLDDGTEWPAEIVLRDKDLDLAFIRPKTRPESPMAAVDLNKSATAQVLDDIIALNRLNKAASRAYAASIEHIAAVIQKPRTFYIPDASMSSTALGSPAFLPDGKILGVFVMRAVSSADDGTRNYRQNITSIILPADDILKAARQAPEAKVDNDKKEEPKPSKEQKDGAQTK
jgi:S1-C subfamily serine protease